MKYLMLGVAVLALAYVVRLVFGVLLAGFPS